MPAIARDQHRRAIAGVAAEGIEYQDQALSSAMRTSAKAYWYGRPQLAGASFDSARGVPPEDSSLAAKLSGPLLLSYKPLSRSSDS